MRAFLRREPALAALVVACACATVLPLWIGRYPPLLDYPNQLSMSYVWYHLHDPTHDFARWYAVNPIPLPYWAEYLLVYALSLPLGPEIAHKIYVSLAVLGLPAAVAVYARQTNRDPRLAIFAFPLAWSFSLTQGFTGYVGGLPVLFLALAALDRHAVRPGWRSGLLVALLGSSLYFFHLLIVALFLVVGGVTALVAPRPWRPLRAVLAALPTVPVAVVAAACWRISSLMTNYGSHRAPTGLREIQGLYFTTGEVLGQLPNWLIDVHPGGSDEVALAALAVCWVLIVAARPLSSSADPDPLDPPVRDVASYRVELACAVAFALCVLLPRSLVQPFYWWAVSRRFGVVFALLAVLSVRGRLDGARRPLLLVVGLVGILFAIDVSAQFHRFNVRARDYDALIAEVPPAKRVLPLIFVDSGPDVNVRAYAQWGTWVQIRQRTFVPFALETKVPIRERAQLASPPWDRPGEFRWAQHGSDWDYFLLHGRGFKPFTGAEQNVRLVGARGDWELWQNVTR